VNSAYNQNQTAFSINITFWPIKILSIKIKRYFPSVVFFRKGSNNTVGFENSQYFIPGHIFKTVNSMSVSK
jgi:hypothetical protein